jgi:phosphonate ABC transporter permease subunit PhnE
LKMKKRGSLINSITLGVAVIVGMVVYAYGFNVIKLDFSETRSERRLASLTRILRALAHPDLVTYEYEETAVSVPFYLPCPEGGIEELPLTDTRGPHISTNVPCAAPDASIQVSGVDFQPGSGGRVHFVASSGVKLSGVDFRADENGQFQIELTLPKRQPVAEAQEIRATGRIRVGAPMPSETAKITWDKILETVFLALIATTFGTLLAIPISFLAARNLMSDVKSPVTSSALSFLGWPIGMFIGILANRWILSITETITLNTGLNVGGVVLSSALALLLYRWAIPNSESEPANPLLRALRFFSMVAATGLIIFFMHALSMLAFNLGDALVEPLGPFGFLGDFISQLGDLLRIITPAIIALAGGGVVGNTLGALGQRISDNANEGLVKVLNMIFTTLAGALLFALVGAAINWFYQIDDPIKIYVIPAAVGGVLGLLMAIWTAPKVSLPTGITVYFIMRTILNATRSVEPLVMVIVFVVWVGIGPFAGSLALALHTVAALAKLYSEQVESILTGPLEAIRATGANRLQTIVYAVIPQIIPPYISFTMYRWDINVRMSTIIGFAGGGGIGFLLQQNINLLNYRAASVQMLAIAIVVASMDYISSTLRERFV